MDLIEPNRPVEQMAREAFEHYPVYSLFSLLDEKVVGMLADVFARLVEAGFVKVESAQDIRQIWEQFLAQNKGQ